MIMLWLLGLNEHVEAMSAWAVRATPRTAAADTAAASAVRLVLLL
jgi:hypothetical protein